MSEPLIYVVAGFPPPVGGQTLVNQQFAERLAALAPTRQINVGAVTLHRGFAYHLSRIRRSLYAFFLLLIFLRRQDRVVFSMDSGLGISYFFFFVIIAKLKRCRFWIYHHSYTYLDKQSRVMQRIARLSQKRGIHVFLCNNMSRDFHKIYKGSFQSCLVPNLAYFELPMDPNRRTLNTPLKLALISHLSEEKGVDLFLDLLERAAAEGLPVEGLLAGPFTGPDVEACYLPRIQALGDRLTFFGPIYGETKDRFFETADVFVFPTRFRVETQPLVLCEAAAKGIPIISYARGCIRDNWGMVAALVPRGEDFVAHALPVLQGWIDAPDSFATTGAATFDHFRASKGDADRRLADLLTVVATSAAS